MHLPNRAGFTLVELLVTVSILALLASIVTSSVKDAREKARIAGGRASDTSIFTTIAANLEGQWLFDEGSGTTAVDNSGSGRTGTLVGTVTRVAGIDDGAISLPGTVGSYVTMSANGLGDAATALTITAWVKVAATTGTTQAVVTRNGPYMLWITNALQVNTGLYQGGTWYWTTTTNTLKLDRWHFLAMTYDGTFRKIYIDGIIQGNPDTQISGAINNGGSGIIRIGSDTCCSDRYAFNGAIDQVRIYTSALSLTQIRQQYAQGAMRHLAIYTP